MVSQKKLISISWSGGKDAGMALEKILTNAEWEVVGLHTVVEQATRRVGLHEVPEELIREQAAAIGLPIDILYLEKKPLSYEKLMVNYYKELKMKGIQHVMFGDIFLEDLKDFREQLLRKAGIKGVYPLWRKQTLDLLTEFFQKEYKSLLCAVDTQLVDENEVGDLLSKEFLDKYKGKIDPCGENGEFHSFLINAPYFKNSLSVNVQDLYKQMHTFKVKNEKGEVEQLTQTFAYAKLAVQ